MICTIAIDDVHPEPGWGMEGDECMTYLRHLHEEFGAKFTLFIPANYHREFPISQYLHWIEWLESLGYFELAAHGHYHDTSDPNRWGECEFAELEPAAAQDRLQKMFNEWGAMDRRPRGWRSPGWLTRPDVVPLISNSFEYAAIHTDHDRYNNWTCKALAGHTGIHADELTTHNGGMIMFQSHINGDWNDNVWNENNYEHMREVLRWLHDRDTIIHKTLGECIT